MTNDKLGGALAYAERALTLRQPANVVSNVGYQAENVFPKKERLTPQQKRTASEKAVERSRGLSRGYKASRFDKTEAELLAEITKEEENISNSNVNPFRVY